MKKQIVSIFAYSILGLSAVMVSCGGDTNKSKSADTENVASEMAFLRVDIEGMTCAVGCAKTIEKMLSETEGVTSAEVDYDKKAAFINYDKSKVTEAALLKSISEYKDGTYTAMVSSKSCKSDCKKACCAVAKVEKKVKETTTKIVKNTKEASKDVSNKVTETIVAGKTRTGKNLNDGKKMLDTGIKAVSTTTNKAIKSGKQGVTKGKSKLLNTGASMVNDGEKSLTKTKSTAKSKINSASKSVKGAEKTANKFLGK